MTCSCTTVEPVLVEELVRDDFLPPAMKGWRRYRIEYGFECSCPEGVIYLPPLACADTVEGWYTDLIRWSVG